MEQLLVKGGELFEVYKLLCLLQNLFNKKCLPRASKAKGKYRFE